MKRVLSALVLLPVVIGAVWLSPLATFVLVEIVVALACVEYVALTRGRAGGGSGFITVTAAMSTCAALAAGGLGVELVLMTALIVCAAAITAAGRHDAEAVRDIAVALFAPIYVGLPLGALVALRRFEGAAVVLLLLGAVMASDTAQYYGGRLFGRRPLAPAISPKKTQEGALSGLIAGTLVLIVAGREVLGHVPVWVLALAGLTIAMLGVLGDLFESVLKRGAGMKDASTLIPGHGGMLDRIDSLLFAAPVYYAVVRYAFSRFHNPL